MTAGTWVLQKSGNTRLPYRLLILSPGAPPLILRTQDRWPTANRNIFCLRESEPAGDEEFEEVERVSILALQRRGVRLSVILERSRLKRCDFLFLTKSYKNRDGETYEQIYWQTQASMIQRRPRVSPPLPSRRLPMTVRIASDERYPWRFPGSTVERKSMPCGDYALVVEGEVQAVVERKTFDNLLADFGVMPVLQQRLLELATYEQNALVVEAAYEDFLNPRKVHHYSPAFCAATIAGLHALNPRLKIVFCANRKTANAWTASFFAAVRQLPAAQTAGSQPPLTATTRSRR